MKRNKPLWIAITAVALVLIVTAATTVVPGLKISQYPLTTAPNGNDLFILADVTVVPNTNRSYKYTTLTNAIITLATNSVRIFAGTNVTVDRTNNGYIISVTNITGGTGGTATASLPLNSIQFNSNTMFAGDSLLMYTNQNVGIGTNNPKYLLSLHNSDITEPAIDIGYDTGAGNTVALQVRSGTGVTNMTLAVDGTLRSVTIFNSGSITGSSATVSALGVTGGTLGAGKVLTDVSGSGSATWQDPTASDVWTNNAGVLHPRVLNGQETNSIQIYTNGGLTVGRFTKTYWGGLAGEGGETLISLRNTTNGEISFNEIFFGVKDDTNSFTHDWWATDSLTRRNLRADIGTNFAVIDEWVDDDWNPHYNAYNVHGFMWQFQPTSVNNDAAYSFDTIPLTITNTRAIVEFNNNRTNKMVLFGNGNLNVEGQITNQFLSTNRFVKTDDNKGLVSSTLNEEGITNLVNGITNSLATTSYVFSVIGNYMSLSVQAAKLPSTNYPAIDAGWQNWELIYYPTNSEGFTNSLGATWQFVVPLNYFTNNMKVYGQNILLTTNGPTSTNIYWRASFLRATSGDSTDVHVGSFGSSVTVTQTWAASATGTNKMQSFLIDMGTSSLLQANDFSILKLERVNDVADTNQFKGSTSLIGLQLRY